MTREALVAEVAAFIERCASHESPAPAERDALLAKVLVFQRAHVAPYARLVQHHVSDAATAPLAWPALPTDVFRFARVAAHPPALDARVFLTSGTTNAERGANPLRTLELYDRAARAAARAALFPDRERMRLMVLAPTAAELPESSLSYMLDRFGPWFARDEVVYAWRDGTLDLERLARALEEATREGEPVALLGTSFAFVHADDGLGARRFALPAGSRIMQTGGFKGRSREIAPAEMLSMLTARYGVPEAFIVAEYGMTELSSQLYESTLRDAVQGHAIGARRLLPPPWVRLTVVDPETLAPAPHGREGLLRLDDLANVDTACAIQTSDRARCVDDGVVVLGRAPGAVPRGCSLALDAALSHAKPRATP